jgi:hypothetical protein
MAAGVFAIVAWACFAGSIALFLFVIAKVCTGRPHNRVNETADTHLIGDVPRIHPEQLHAHSTDGTGA